MFARTVLRSSPYRIIAPIHKFPRTFHSTARLLIDEEYSRNEHDLPNENTGGPNPIDLITRNDILQYSETPVNYIESVLSNGFLLNSNILIQSRGKDTIGLLLVGSEAFELNLSTPKEGFRIIDQGNNEMVTFDDFSIEVFNKVHPKPEIVCIGLGKKARLLDPAVKNWFDNLGISLDISTSENAARNFDLLATERPGQIGGILLPPNV